MKVIVYPTETGVAIVTPAPGYDIAEVAARDVPKDTPFLIMARDDLPDYATRNRWMWQDGAIVIGPDQPPPDISQMSFAQLVTGLVAEGWITEAEGDAWLAGTLPATVTALIGQMPARARFAAKAKAVRPSVVLLSDPLVQALAAAQGKAGDMQSFFNTYGAE